MYSAETARASSIEAELTIFGLGLSAHWLTRADWFIDQASVTRYSIFNERYWSRPLLRGTHGLPAMWWGNRPVRRRCIHVSSNRGIDSKDDQRNDDQEDGGNNAPQRNGCSGPHRRFVGPCGGWNRRRWIARRWIRCEGIVVKLGWRGFGCLATWMFRHKYSLNLRPSALTFLRFGTPALRHDNGIHPSR